MPNTSVSQADANYRNQPLEPRRFPVDGRSRGKYSEEEIEQARKQAAKNGVVREQEMPEVVRSYREGMRNEGRGEEAGKHHGQQPGIAIVYAQKQYGKSNDEKQHWIGVQNLFRYGPPQGLGITVPFYGAKGGRQSQRVCLSGSLDSQNHRVAGPRLFPDVLQKVE